MSERRSFVRRFTAFTAILLWTPVLLGFSFYLTGKLQGYAPTIFGVSDSYITQWLGLRFLPVLLSTLGLTIVYVVVPNTRVSVRSAAFGALVAAAGWELVKLTFSFYVVKVMSYSKVYGSLAVIPVFIIGLYLLWVVVFLGAEIAFVMHNYQYQESWDERELSGLKPFLAVGVMLELGRRFNEGEKAATLDMMAKKFRVAIPKLREVFEGLIEKGLVIRMNESTYFPAKSLKLISVQDVLSAAVGEIGVMENIKGSLRTVIIGLPDSVVTKLGEALSGVTEAHHRLLGGATLDNLLEVDGPEGTQSRVAAASVVSS